MLVRRIARPLLASPFIYGGISTLRNPQSRVPGAAPIVEQLTEVAEKQLPIEVSKDVEQWVKINAGIHVGAGSLLALGRLPRIASLALAWARNGAIAGLLDGVLDHVRSLFGMG